MPRLAAVARVAPMCRTKRANPPLTGKFLMMLPLLLPKDGALPPARYKKGSAPLPDPALFRILETQAWRARRSSSSLFISRSKDAGGLVAVKQLHKAGGLDAGVHAHHHHLHAAHKEVAGIAVRSRKKKKGS